MQCNRENLKRALRANLQWFIESGVMLPPDGLWGVAERVVLTKNNDALDKIYTSFPVWTKFAEHTVIEQRRADCNFQAALLFLMASEIFHCDQHRKVAENLLEFLYFRSGLLNRYPKDPDLTGTWLFSNIRTTTWYDDNSWNSALSLLIAGQYPELDEKFDLKQWGLTLADNLAKPLSGPLNEPPKSQWSGHITLPHWGSLMCMALAHAYAVEPRPEYRAAIENYHDHLEENRETFIASEMAYAMLGSSCCYGVFREPRFEQLARYFADRLMHRMDPVTGNLPAEHHESPVGPHLVDTIYTINWATLGFQNLYAVTGHPPYHDAFERLAQLLLKIQDQSEEKHLRGCWRGLYDLDAGAWGGGDCYEGGANSIYTGWTNAPIAFSFAFELLGSSLSQGTIKAELEKPLESCTPARASL